MGNPVLLRTVHCTNYYPAADTCLPGFPGAVVRVVIPQVGYFLEGMRCAPWAFVNATQSWLMGSPWQQNKN